MDNARAAQLVMDVQPAIAERFDHPGLLARIADAAEAARRAGVRVVYVRVSFRPGCPEIGDRNQTFARFAQAGNLVEGESTQVHPAVAPQPGEVVVTKRRVSAFAGSELDVVLRAGGTDALVLTGISTSGVVLSTLRQAADLDFSLTVLCDGCADPDGEVHRVLCEKVFPHQAQVLTVADWIASLA